MNKKSKLIVCGYIRSQHKLLFESNQHPLFQNVIISLQALCTLYYHSYDYFDLVHFAMILSQDGQTLTRPTISGNNFANSNYGKAIIPSMDTFISRWYLKMEHLTNSFIVGVSSRPFIKGLGFTSNNNNYHYAFYVNGEYKLKRYENLTFEGTRYGSRLNNDFILCLELNLKNKTISFYINGVNQGVAFNHIATGDDIKYRFSITLGYCDNSVSIVKFTQTKD